MKASTHAPRSERASDTANAGPRSEGASDTKVLVSGFGPFLDVVDNPSARLAEALAGAHEGWVARAIELPTSFARAPAMLDAAAAGCDFVLALGVGRSGLRLERLARGVVAAEAPDIDGEIWAGRSLGDDLENPLPLGEWAAEIGAELSLDCGGYVCNAMNHHVLGRWPGRGLFVHVPRGLQRDTAEFAAVLEALLRLVSLALAHLDSTRGSE